MRVAVLWLQQDSMCVVLRQEKSVQENIMAQDKVGSTNRWLKKPSRVLLKED